MRIANPMIGPRTSVARLSKGRFGRAALIISALALVMICGSPWRSRAQTERLVSPFGDDLGGTNDCTSPDQPCETIQNAVNQSGSGDLIELAPGTYFENVTIGQSVTIQGDSTLGSTVNGNNSGSVFVINGGSTVNLIGLTITNGNSPFRGGGIHNADNGILTVVNCTISGNRAFGAGGGIMNDALSQVTGATLTVINSTISGNQVGNEGGGGGILNIAASTATLVNTTISGNSGPMGANLYNDSTATLNLHNTIIAGSTGGGADCFNAGIIVPSGGREPPLAYTKGNDHPYPKSLEPFKWLIRNSTELGDTVLDPFMGSGTTGVAAVHLGRKFIGIEIEQKYFGISCRRIADAIRQPDMFLEKPKLRKDKSSLFGNRK